MIHRKFGISTSKSKKTEQKEPLASEKKRGSEQSERLSHEDSDSGGLLNPVITTVSSPRNPLTPITPITPPLRRVPLPALPLFHVNQPQAQPADAAQAGDSPFTPTSPRGQGGQRKPTPFGRKPGGSPHKAPRPSWAGARKQTQEGPPQSKHGAEQGEPGTVPETPRSLMSARREKAADTLYRLQQDQLISLAQTGTGETVCLLSMQLDPEDLWKACTALPLDTPEHFATSCAVLEAALPLLAHQSQRHQVLERFLTALDQSELPQRLPSHCPNIRDAVLEFTEHRREAKEQRIGKGLQQAVATINGLREGDKTSVEAGMAVLAQLHELLFEASDLEQWDLADQIVAAAQSLAPLYPQDQASPIQKAARALFATRQAAMQREFGAPCYETLFGAPSPSDLTRHGPLVQIQGIGEQAQFSVHGPIDAAAVNALSEVWQVWWRMGRHAEADALLGAVLAAAKDAAAAQQLTQIMSATFYQSLHQSPDQRTKDYLFGQLARLHEASPLQPDELEAIVDQFAERLYPARYDFEAMRGLHQAVDRMRQALQNQPQNAPPALILRCTELTQACKDALGPLLHFKKRWTLKQSARGKVLELTYRPSHANKNGQAGRVRGDRLALQKRQQAIDLRRDQLGLTPEDAPVREHLMKLYGAAESLRANLSGLPFKPKKLEGADADLVRDVGELHAHEHGLREEMENHDGDLAMERQMLIANVCLFLQDPLGPKWSTLQKALMAACTSLGWAPDARQWLRWSVLAGGHPKAAKNGGLKQLEKRIQRTLADAEKRLSRANPQSSSQTIAALALAETQQALFESLVDLMEQHHVGWTNVQAAMDAVKAAFGWTLDDGQLNALYKLQAKRGDAKPLEGAQSRPDQPQHATIVLPPLPTTPDDEDKH